MLLTGNSPSTKSNSLKQKNRVESSNWGGVLFVGGVGVGGGFGGGVVWGWVLGVCLFFGGGFWAGNP